MISNSVPNNNIIIRQQKAASLLSYKSKVHVFVILYCSSRDSTHIKIRVNGTILADVPQTLQLLPSKNFLVVVCHSVISIVQDVLNLLT